MGNGRVGENMTPPTGFCLKCHPGHCQFDLDDAACTIRLAPCYGCRSGFL